MNPEKMQKFNKSEQEPKIEEVNLKDLKRGDKIIVKVGEKTTYEITLLGREKGSANVKLKITTYSADNPEQPQIEELTARMPGGFEMNKGAGIMNDIIKAGGEYTLYFENIKDKNEEPYAGKMRTEPVSQILKVDKQKEK